MIMRNVCPDDYPSIIASLDEWWGGRKMSTMLPRLFFEHFGDTSFIIEEDGKIVAFLIGFLSQSQPEEAYIHFVGVHPQYRKRGYARLLYEHFFTYVHNKQRQTVRCVTAPINATSIAFHACMGFRTEPGQAVYEGVAYDPNHDGPGEHRVCFVRQV
ncbi:MAG: GNAT family N-acetyltransferase [Chloroflexi bacterium RBG_13_48_10]|nr:MAG: GNAT family N-acetyltransferase [Chloroflexi bacterium RBG_13_48_10]